MKQDKRKNNGGARIGAGRPKSENKRKAYQYYLNDEERSKMNDYLKLIRHITPTVLLR